MIFDRFPFFTAVSSVPVVIKEGSTMSPQVKMIFD